MDSSSSVCKGPAVPMASTASDEIAPLLAARQNVEHLGAKSRTGKRKAPAAPSDEADLCEDSRRISGEIENLRSQLDRKVKELEYCEQNKKLRVELECLRKQVQELKTNNNQGFQKNAKDNDSKLEPAIIEEKRADEYLVKLAEGQKREKEDVLERMLQLMKELHDKLQGMQDLEEEKEYLEELSQVLVRKERASTQELQDSKKTLIEGFLEYMPGKKPVIGIKWMGQLAEKPFLDACRRKHGDDDPDTKAAILVSSWQEEVKNPSWHPFKFLEVDGKTQEVVDEDDVKLTQLRTECGDDVCNAVKVALAELNEYNPSGRNDVLELWNFGERRKATMTEALNCIFNQLKKCCQKKKPAEEVKNWADWPVAGGSTTIVVD